MIKFSVVLLLSWWYRLVLQVMYGVMWLLLLVFGNELQCILYSVVVQLLIVQVMLLLMWLCYWQEFSELCWFWMVFLLNCWQLWLIISEYVRWLEKCLQCLVFQCRLVFRFMLCIDLVVVLIGLISMCIIWLGCMVVLAGLWIIWCNVFWYCVEVMLWVLLLMVWFSWQLVLFLRMWVEFRLVILFLMWML